MYKSLDHSPPSTCAENSSLRHLPLPAILSPSFSACQNPTLASRFKSNATSTINPFMTHEVGINLLLSGLPMPFAISLQCMPYRAMPSRFSHVWFCVTLWTTSLHFHGILQSKTLEWVAMPSSRGSSQPRDQTRSTRGSCIGRWILYHRAT